MGIKTTENARLWGELVVSIFRLNAAFVAKGNEIAKPAGQTSARWYILAAAYLRPQTVSQIARRMGQTRQSVQRIADILAEERLATFEENKDHKKSKLVALTEKGKEAMEAIAREQLVYANRLGKKIPKEQVEHLLERLRQLEKVVGAT